MGEAVIRFFIGGVFVSAFAVLGSILKPKSFAGLFGAAPSVALATLFLTVRSDSVAYAAIEARSMILGSVAFLVYAYCVSFVLMRYQFRSSLTATFLIATWLGVAMGLRWII